MISHLESISFYLVMASRVHSDIAGNPYMLEILPPDLFGIASNPKFVPTQSQSPNSLQSTVDPEVKDGFKIECGETKMQITVKREFFRTRGIYFSPDVLHLGENFTSSGSCRAFSEEAYDNEIVISSTLQGCGSKSRVRNVGEPTNNINLPMGHLREKS